MLSNQQFDRTRRLALSLAGIELVERHRELLARRCRRLGIHDDAGLDSLLHGAEAGEISATQRLLCLLTTKFTGFFRHPRHFEIAAEHAVRVAGQRGLACLWSAGTATGEEAWSLAIALAGAFQFDEPPVSILATDIDAEALVAAGRGEYGERALQTLSLARRERYLIPAATPRRYCVAPILRRLVEFQPMNLANPTWEVGGRFDVIFCRNVLMYLEADHRVAVLMRMASLLAPDGLLILDPAEHLGKAAHLFSPGADGLYYRRSVLSRNYVTTTKRI